MPGSWSAFAKDTLWLAPDHILYVVMWFITEDYKRFYFRDVQAITLHRTKQGKYINIVLTIIGLASVPAAFFTGEEARFFFFFSAGITGVFVLINIWLGPTCECYMQTAVQRVKLNPLTRIKKARKVMNYLNPVILEAQSENV